MKILEPQSALLSNYEVLAHVNAVRAESRPTPQKHRNVETVLKEVTDYLSPTSPSTSGGATTASPLPPYTNPQNYSPATISELMQRLKPFLVSKNNPAGLYKNEVFMMVNLRPKDLGLLDCIVEECDERFSEEQQVEILGIVQEVLGGEEEDEEEGKGMNGVLEEHGEREGRR